MVTLLIIPSADLANAGSLKIFRGLMTSSGSFCDRKFTELNISLDMINHSVFPVKPVEGWLKESCLHQLEAQGDGGIKAGDGTGFALI